MFAAASVNQKLVPSLAAPLGIPLVRKEPSGVKSAAFQSAHALGLARVCDEDPLAVEGDLAWMRQPVARQCRENRSGGGADDRNRIDW